MNSYYIRVSPKSTLSSIPDSRTLFGAICWAIHDLYGSEELENLLDNFTTHKNRFVVSSMFPDGFMPLPIGYFLSELTEMRAVTKSMQLSSEDQLNWLRKLKAFKKVEFIELKLWNQLMRNEINKKEMLQSYLLEEKVGIEIRHKRLIRIEQQNNSEALSSHIKETKIRNAINRLSGTTEKGQNLFYSELIHCGEENLSFYLKTDNPEYFDSVWKYLSDSSIGGNKSVGMNRFDITRITEVKWENSTPYHFLLSKYIPNQDEVSFQSSFYQIKKTYDMAESRNELFETTPSKAGLTYVLEGATLLVKSNEEICGQLPIVKNTQTMQVRSNGLGFLV